MCDPCKIKMYVFITFGASVQIRGVTGAKYVFLVPILTSNDEGLIQVVGDRILDKGMRFAVSSILKFLIEL